MAANDERDPKTAGRVIMELEEKIDKRKWMEECARWIEDRIGCEVYFLHRDQEPNGFVEYRNGGHIIYILGDLEQMEFPVFLDILAHEAGHVLYNQRQMQKGIPYEEIVRRTRAKLYCFDQLLARKLIDDEEYDRLYAAIEEEWESNKEKEKILAELQTLLPHQ
jgi:hypothetical protein